jgi:hypothetical protein
MDSHDHYPRLWTMHGKDLSFGVRISHQIVNSFLIAAAILSAACVGAISAKSFGLAAVVAFSGSAVSLVAMFGYYHHIRQRKERSCLLNATRVTTCETDPR